LKKKTIGSRHSESNIYGNWLPVIFFAHLNFRAQVTKSLISFCRSHFQLRKSFSTMKVNN